MATEVELDRLPDPAIVADAAGNIIAANSQAMALFGYAVLEGMSVEELVASDAKERHLQHRARYNHAPRQRPMSTGAPLVARLASGELANVEISLGPLGQGQTIALIRNATERIQKEQEYRATRTKLIETLEEMNAVLRADLRELRHTLARINERLEKLEDGKVAQAAATHERLRRLEDAEEQP